jgi:hypothetical protein
MPEGITPISRLLANQKSASGKPLPASLRHEVESLSGISMNDIRVHYNSAVPTHLNALAYTHNTDIHVAPGQEQHLPHEAWHVAQNRQSRVQPAPMATGLAMNNDTKLEAEADAMGAKAVQA